MNGFVTAGASHLSLAGVAVAIFTCALVYSRSQISLFLRILFLLASIEALYLAYFIPSPALLFGIGLRGLSTAVCEISVLAGIPLVALSLIDPRLRGPLAVGSGVGLGIAATAGITLLVRGADYEFILHSFGFLEAMVCLWALWFHPSPSPPPVQRLRQRFTSVTLVILPFDALDLFGREFAWAWTAPFQGRVIAVYLVAVSLVIAIEAWRWLKGAPAQVPPSPGTDLTELKLSSRQEEIASLILEGLSAKEIAQRLEISPKTVENHTYSIYRKAGVRSRLQFYQSFRG